MNDQHVTGSALSNIVDFVRVTQRSRLRRRLSPTRKRLLVREIIDVGIRRTDSEGSGGSARGYRESSVGELLVLHTFANDRGLPELLDVWQAGIGKVFSVRLNPLELVSLKKGDWIWTLGVDPAVLGGR